MTRFLSLFVLILIVACGGKSHQDGDSVTIVAACETPADCSREGARCVEGMCEYTETVEVEVEVEVQTECVVEECVCPQFFTAFCVEKNCQCTEDNPECWPLTRGEVAQRFYDELEWDNGIPYIGQTYPDVPADHPNFQAIEAMAFRKLINGASDGFFRPDDYINRAEAAKVVTQTMMVPAPTGTVEAPADVQEDAWYYSYLMGMLEYELQGPLQDGQMWPVLDTTNCFLDLAIERAKEFHPISEDKRVYFMQLGAATASQTVTAGTHGIHAMELVISSPISAELQDLTLYFYTVEGPVEVTQIVKEVRLYNHEQLIDVNCTIQAVASNDGGKAANIDCPNLAVELEGMIAETISVVIDLQDDIPVEQVLIPAMIPCDRENSSKVVSWTGEILPAHDDVNGCAVANAHKITIVTKL